VSSTQGPLGEPTANLTAPPIVRGRPFSIVCLSSQDWRTPLPTNRQQIMVRAARRGHAVLFVETSDFIGKHLWRALRSPDRRSLVSRLVSTERVDPEIRVRKALNVLPWGFTRVSANAANWRVTGALLRRLVRSLPQPVVLWVYDPSAARALGSCGEALAVYDCVDDYAEQTTSERKRAFVRAADRRAAERARLVFTTSRTMYERQRSVNPATHLVPNVGDYEHFRQAIDRRVVLPDAATLRRPVIGFAGNFLATKVDLDLLERVARARPDWTLLLIGPAVNETTASLNRVAKLANVCWLGHKPYAELPGYVSVFDVGLIPYVSNAYTRSCFPLKLYEYLAAGKPVVATGLPELAGMEPDVLLVDGVEALINAVEHALELRDPVDVARRVELASRNSWEVKTEHLLQLIDAELGV
jgi:glycosyltransferase involved in cell wall biosynthesis